MSKSSILFLTTGGTIDSEGYPSDETPKNVKAHNPSQMKKKLDILGLHGKYHFVQICAEDSKGVTDIHLDEIISLIKNSQEHNIIITHGTDTIVRNAQYLEKSLQKLNILNRKICFLGSFEPLDNGSKTDGWDNLRRSVTHIESLPSGVSVAIRSKFYRLNNLKKDFVTKQMVGTEIIL